MSYQPISDPQNVRTPFSNPADQSLAEQLAQMNGALRAMLHVLTQILAVSRGLPDPLLADEANTLIAEFTNPANDLLNMIN